MTFRSFPPQTSHYRAIPESKVPGAIAEDSKCSLLRSRSTLGSLSMQLSIGPCCVYEAICDVVPGHTRVSPKLCEVIWTDARVVR